MISTKKILSITMASIIPCIVHAGGEPEPYSGQTKKERQQVALSNKWASGQLYKTTPTLAEDGSIRFIYGSEAPTIICAILQVCDIALEPGEVVNNINIGDKVRWNVEPAVTGAGESQRLHLIVKPLESGIQTTMVVATNKRAYHFRLKSTKRDYMAFVSFIYPEDLNAQLRNVQQQQQRTALRQNMPGSGGMNAKDLNFKYSLSGNPSWKPLRVYDNGRQTFIQMPGSMSTSDAPALLVVKEKGGLFSDDRTAIVNYRLLEDKYVVDGIFDRAILVSGVGGSQEKVTIEKSGD